MEIREMKDQIKELVGLLRQSEMKRKEAEKESKVREQAGTTTLATPASVRLLLLCKALYTNKNALSRETDAYANKAILAGSVNIMPNLDLGFFMGLE
jgi:kinesin family protein 4/21/27